MAFNDLSCAYFQRLWRKHGYELMLPLSFEEFSEVTQRIATSQTSTALEMLGDSRLGLAARAALAQPEPWILPEASRAWRIGALTQEEALASKQQL